MNRVALLYLHISFISAVFYVIGANVYASVKRSGGLLLETWFPTTFPGKLASRKGTVNVRKIKRNILLNLNFG